MKAALFCVALCASLAARADSPSTNATDRPTVIVVVGAAGEEAFGKNFARSAGLWEKASSDAGAKSLVLGLQTEAMPPDHDRLQQALLDEPKEGAGELWLVLLGHGTFDGKEAKFNLRGPDLEAEELAKWLAPFRRPVAIINTASASGPFLNKLSAPERVIITAAKSGYEQNYTRFGQYFSEAITDPLADLDKDGQVSLLEAFLTASHRVAEFYKTEGRLSTEHALLDDNGDGLGTPADWFRGIRAVKKTADGSSLDGLRAHQFHLIHSAQERKLSPAQRKKRDELELSVIKLRESKKEFQEEDYYRRLETLLVELARVYEQNNSEPK